jgi:hypothetical protein
MCNAFGLWSNTLLASFHSFYHHIQLGTYSLTWCVFTSLLSFLRMTFLDWFMTDFECNQDLWWCFISFCVTQYLHVCVNCFLYNWNSCSFDPPLSCPHRFSVCHLWCPNFISLRVFFVQHCLVKKWMFFSWFFMFASSKYVLKLSPYFPNIMLLNKDYICPQSFAGFILPCNQYVWPKIWSNADLFGDEANSSYFY